MKDRLKYSDEEWENLVKRWQEAAPELSDWARITRETFPGARVTYVGPKRKTR
jgi:hypothetical protein